MNNEVRCDHCGEVIGVYEPLVVIVDGEALHTSRAAAADPLGDGPRFHGICFTRARNAGDVPVE